MPDPGDYSRRSPLYRKLSNLGATFGSVNSFAAAQSCGGDVLDEASQAQSLALVDLTSFRRTGFKGWNITPWLAKSGAKYGDGNNLVYQQDDGSRIARLAPGEVIVLANRLGNSALADHLDAAWSMEKADGCFRVPREEMSCWLMISGAQAFDMLAKMCAVDLRPNAFKVNSVAQTNIARLNAIVIRDDIGTIPAFDLLTDIASAVYLWDALLDAMEEFNGVPVGLAAIRSLNQEQ